MNRLDSKKIIEILQKCRQNLSYDDFVRYITEHSHNNWSNVCQCALIQRKSFCTCK